MYSFLLCFIEKEAREGAGAAEWPIPLSGSPVCPEGSRFLQRHKAKPSVLLRIQIQAAIFKMGIQQGPTVLHREPCSVLCCSLDGMEFGGRWIHGYRMDESLCCPSETITTLLIGCTPIQNKKLNKIKREREKKSLRLHGSSAVCSDLVELNQASLRPRSLQSEVPSF